MVIRCDSYNTAQIQLLSGSEAAARLSAIPEASRPEMPVSISRQNSRGRSRHSNHSRQPTTSAPPSALVVTRRLLEGTSWPNPRLREANSLVPSRTQFTPPSSPSNGSSDPDDSMDTGEDVDFWGGESPWSRLSSPNHGQDIANNDSEDDDDDDEENSEDEDMSEDGDGDEDETDEYNRMEIFGHR